MSRRREQAEGDEDDDNDDAPETRKERSGYKERRVARDKKNAKWLASRRSMIQMTSESYACPSTCVAICSRSGSKTKILVIVHRRESVAHDALLLQQKFANLERIRRSWHNDPRRIFIPIGEASAPLPDVFRIVSSTWITTGAKQNALVPKSRAPQVYGFY